MAWKNEVVLSSRTVIQNRLLAALEDDASKVAIVASKKDLIDLIEALDDSIGHGPEKDVLRRKWIDYLEQLRSSAFGE